MAGDQQNARQHRRDDSTDEPDRPPSEPPVKGSPRDSIRVAQAEVVDKAKRILRRVTPFKGMLAVRPSEPSIHDEEEKK